MRLAAAGTHALLLATTGACSGAAGTDEPIEVTTYAALGDSYSAAPGVPVTERTSGCDRSSGSYPARVAEQLGVTTHVDVTCGGAGTRNLTQSQATPRGPVPPQLDAVPADADLVTVGIGVNDGLFAKVFGACLQVAAQDPEGAPCQEAMAGAGGTDVPEEVLHDLRGSLEASLRAVEERAPGAEVVLVGYPQLVPAEGTCAELPLARGDYGYVRSAMADLDEVMAQAAEAAGTRYVSLLGPSEGHDVCAGDEAWVNGMETDERALGLHPLAEEQQVVADLVVETLSAG